MIIIFKCSFGEEHAYPLRYINPERGLEIMFTEESFQNFRTSIIYRGSNTSASLVADIEDLT